MSKSLGNFFTVRDLLDRGVPGEVMRFVLLSTHYRQPIDWTEAKVEEATRTLRKWRRVTDGVESDPQVSGTYGDALADDLNTPAALVLLHEMSERPSELKSAAAVLGLLQDELSDWDWRLRQFSAAASVGGSAALRADATVVTLRERFEEKVKDLIERRALARSQREFELADKIRAALDDAGVKVMDRPGAHPEWELPAVLDPAKLEALE
jgi:cysteinyl-tRNA synthetase